MPEVRNVVSIPIPNALKRFGFRVFGTSSNAEEPPADVPCGSPCTNPCCIGVIYK